ncbi:MAG: hypothetical protein ACR2QJ_10330 [Geminicoccaceae bacterium]
MRSLDVLRRLARQAVEQERRALLAIGTEIEAVEGDIEAMRRAIGIEASKPLDFMTSGATLAAFIAANKQRMRDLEVRRQQLQLAYDAQLERMRDERTEEKRYELLAERRARQAALEAAAKEQKTIDELVAIKAARPPDGGRPT